MMDKIPSKLNLRRRLQESWGYQPDSIDEGFYCIEGACAKAVKGRPAVIRVEIGPMLRSCVVETGIRKTEPTNIVAFNDNKSIKFSDIASVLDCAIKKTTK